MKRVKTDNDTNNKKYEFKQAVLQILKEPYFYLMAFLWLFTFCLAVYAILIGAIVPY